MNREDLVGSDVPERGPKPTVPPPPAPHPARLLGLGPRLPTPSCAERGFSWAREGLWREGSVRAEHGQAASALPGEASLALLLGLQPLPRPGAGSWSLCFVLFCFSVVVFGFCSLK